MMTELENNTDNKHSISSLQSTSPTLQSTLKSQDTEEWLDLHFTRPLGFLWARFFNRFNVHPNVVTILSIILGVIAGILFYFEDLWLNVLGIFFLVWANLYDSADGQLARMSGKKSRIGRALDGFAGDVWFFVIYFSLCMRLMPVWGIWIWVLSAVAGLVCHSKQCQLADYYRNIHLFFLRGENGSELDSSSKLRDEFHKTLWKGNFIWKIYLFFYARYTASQEKMTPAFQKLKQFIDKNYAKEGLPAELRVDFRKGSLPLMKYANILTFNTRAIALYLSLLIGEPWLYPVFEIFALTPLSYYMRSKHERLCRQLYDKYSSLHD